MTNHLLKSFKTKSILLVVIFSMASFISAPARADRKEYLLVGPFAGVLTPPYAFYGAGGSALFFDRLQINALLGASFFEFLFGAEANYQIPFWHLFGESNKLSVGAGWVRGEGDDENDWGNGQFAFANLSFIVDTRWFSQFAERTQLSVGLSGVTKVSKGFDSDDHDWIVWPQARLHLYF